MYWSAHYKFVENFNENPGWHQPGCDSSCATSMLHPFQRRQNVPSSRYRSCNDLKLQRSLVTCSFPCQCDYIGTGGFDLRECDEMAGVFIHRDSLGASDAWKWTDLFDICCSLRLFTLTISHPIYAVRIQITLLRKGKVLLFPALPLKRLVCRHCNDMTT